MSSIHREFRYDINVQFEYKGELIDLEPFNIKALNIGYYYEVYNNPIVVLFLKVDRKLKNAIINNSKDANKNFINLSVYKYPYDPKNKNNNNDKVIIKENVIFKRFQYVINKNETPFNEEDDSPDSQDYKKLDTIIIGLYDQSVVDNCRIKFNSVVYQSNLSSLVLHILSRYKNLLIEPFEDKYIDQLIIPPQDSIRKLLSFISYYYNIYNTKYILFHDFDRSYFISKNGKSIKAKGDKYTKINIEMNNEDKRIFVETNGAYYSDNDNITIVASNIDEVKIVDNEYNGLNGTLGVVSSDGNYKEVSFNNDANINIYDISTSNVDIIDIYKNEIKLSLKMAALSKSGLDTLMYTINKEYYIINNDTNETLRCLLVEKFDSYIYDEKEFILNTTMKFKIIQ